MKLAVTKSALSAHVRAHSACHTVETSLALFMLGTSYDEVFHVKFDPVSCSSHLTSYSVATHGCRATHLCAERVRLYPYCFLRIQFAEVSPVAPLVLDPSKGRAIGVGGKTVAAAVRSSERDVTINGQRAQYLMQQAVQRVSSGKTTILDGVEVGKEVNRAVFV